MDQFHQMADQRTQPSASEAEAPRGQPAAAGGLNLSSDLPAVLLAVLPLIQAIGWVETAAAATLGALQTVPADPALVAPAIGYESELAIERALSAIVEPAQQGGGELVYAADVSPLSLDISVSDLFSDAGTLTGVTPRVTTAAFVDNVENDIFGRELNVAATPLGPPDKSQDPGGSSVMDNPIEGPTETQTESVATNTGDLIAMGNGWYSSMPWNPDKHPPGTQPPVPEGVDPGGGSAPFLPPPPDSDGGGGEVDLGIKSLPTSDIVP